jgi:hypothetical protein
VLWKWASGTTNVHVWLTLATGAVLGGHSLLQIHQTAHASRFGKDNYLLQLRLLGTFDLEQ